MHKTTDDELLVEYVKVGWLGEFVGATAVGTRLHSSLEYEPPES